ncbi:MAG: hypothetical protein ABSC16_11415 [Candidatus Dormibacteria bacterium]
MIPPPPAPPLPPGAPPQPLFRRVLRPLIAALVAVIVFGALGFFIVDDLGQWTKVQNVSDRLSSEQSAYGVDQQAIAAMQSQNAALQSQEAADQQQIVALQSQNAALQSQVPTTPDFMVVGTGWNGSCNLDGCYARAVRPSPSSHAR